MSSPLAPAIPSASIFSVSPLLSASRKLSPNIENRAASVRKYEKLACTRSGASSSASKLPSVSAATSEPVNGPRTTGREVKTGKTASPTGTLGISTPR